MRASYPAARKPSPARLRWRSGVATSPDGRGGLRASDFASLKGGCGRGLLGFILGRGGGMSAFFGVG
ncbi:MAG: hypothetical protein ACK5VT_07415, partial [Alphaproteobacteria bacterium]